MPAYTPPDFSTLFAASKDLKRDLSKVVKGFNLRSHDDSNRSMSWAELKHKVANIQTEYDKAAAEIWTGQSYFSRSFRLFGTAASVAASAAGLSHSSAHTTDRQGQITAITDLINILDQSQARGSDSKDDEYDKKRIYILLGALFYRYIRFIKNDYSTVEAALAQSALFNVIYKLLGLSTEKLDDWTIMKRCQYYYKFLKKNDTSKLISYINEDGRFFNNLTEIIETAAAMSKPIIDQLAYIDFIVSVGKTLESFNRILLPLLDDVVKHKQSFNSTQAILDYLVKHEDLMPYHCEYLKLVIENDPTEFSENDHRADVLKTCDDAISHIKQVVDARNRYTLLGAYVLVLGHCTSGAWPDKQIQPDLLLLHGLIDPIIDNELTKKLDFDSRNTSLTVLAQFVGLSDIAKVIKLEDTAPCELPNTNPVDIQYWRYVENLQSDIGREIIEIGPFLKKEREQRETEATLAAASQYSMSYKCM